MFNQNWLKLQSIQMCELLLQRSFQHNTQCHDKVPPTPTRQPRPSWSCSRILTMQQVIVLSFSHILSSVQYHIKTKVCVKVSRARNNWRTLIENWQLEEFCWNAVLQNKDNFYFITSRSCWQCKMIRQNIFFVFTHVYAEKCFDFAFQGVYVV